MHSFEKILSNKKIFITGHTGFTGSWASLWLASIGAQLTGYSLKPNTEPSLFESVIGEDDIYSIYGDICNYQFLSESINAAQPDLILHLAAQPLVRKSYQEPLNTFLTNTQGTANVLEAARNVKSVKGVLCITTDKVYKNNEWCWPYRENDPLGGKDPYSASKAAAEMIIQSYASSYPWIDSEGPAIATARGGNIIGGGDWSEDRLIPDFVRSIVNKEELILRYPEASRPWQHVLALVYGYLILLAGLTSENPKKYATSWNLGPLNSKHHTVRELLEKLSVYWERPMLKYTDNPLPESLMLALDSSRAHNQLGWQPAWETDRVIRETAEWYRSYYSDSKNSREITMAQINAWRKEI